MINYGAQRYRLLYKRRPVGKAFTAVNIHMDKSGFVCFFVCFLSGVQGWVGLEGRQQLDQAMDGVESKSKLYI